LHLAEVYEETFRIESCVRSFLKNRNDAVMAHLVVGLEHMGRNHISFVQQALEWAANDLSWAEPSIPRQRRAPSR
jgi:hypothetical protein